ncbi:Aste57867_20167 [Aphanomyces stellatus]|uniref:Aste57867_20167 protein n=1 Tax=Aphanomyces stellatus TaxID=120398 RepID=A0A485LFK4_9STRA|nr:hypothetical protein As57867_020101 [Aphanomyces stellatus]VFT96862.1 Aste57867_20167 [Aphanomyces stellatus]
MASHQSKSVIVQQDNAKPYVLPNDADFREAYLSDGWDMVLKCQPANLPDLNVLDLGFFRVIQTLQQIHRAKSIDVVIAATLKAWAKVDPATLNRNFLTLQCYLLQVIKQSGGNGYKIPHMTKSSLTSRGLLPETIMCPVDMDEMWAELAAEVSDALEIASLCTFLEEICVDDDGIDDAAEDALLGN